MGASQRRKGQVGERKLVHELKEAFPDLADGFKRGFQSRGGGAEQPDVMGLPGYHLEHKSGKMPNPRAALKQAIEDAQDGARPVAVIRDDRCPPFVVMELETFFDLVRKVMGVDKDAPLGENDTCSAKSSDSQ